MSNKFLTSIELPEQTTDAESNPVSSVRLYAQAHEVFRKDSTGEAIQLKTVNPFSSDAEKNAVFTYTGSDVTRIDYDSGNYKLITYSSGLVTQLDYLHDSKTYRRVFNYDIGGNILSIDESVIP